MTALRIMGAFAALGCAAVVLVAIGAAGVVGQALGIIPKPKRGVTAHDPRYPSPAARVAAKRERTRHAERRQTWLSRGGDA